MSYAIIMTYINIIKIVLINELEKDHSMIDTRLLKNVVIFIQTVLSFVLSQKIVVFCLLQFGSIAFGNLESFREFRPLSRSLNEDPVPPTREPDSYPFIICFPVIISSILSLADSYRHSWICFFINHKEWMISARLDSSSNLNLKALKI